MRFLKTAGKSLHKCSSDAEIDGYGRAGPPGEGAVHRYRMTPMGGKPAGGDVHRWHEGVTHG
jgi:hypothetical protein